MFQTELSLNVDNGIVLLPAALPGYETYSYRDADNISVGACVVANVPNLQIQFRLHDHFMGRFHLFSKFA
jgi:hypothetical protein